jgi:hypothetical protein
MSNSDFMAREILAMVREFEDDQVRWQAFNAVENLAIRTQNLEGRRAYFLSFLGDSDFRIQVESAILLSNIDNKVTNGVPVLIKALTDNFYSQTLTSRFARIMPASQVQRMIRSNEKRVYEALQNVSPAAARQVQVPDDGNQ